MSGRGDTAALPTPAKGDGTFHKLSDVKSLDAVIYAGKTAYTTPAVKTNTDIATEFTTVLEDFISEMKKEFKLALQELETTRVALNTNNKSLLRTLKTLPMSAERRAIRDWVMKEERTP